MTEQNSWQICFSDRCQVLYLLAMKIHLVESKMILYFSVFDFVALLRNVDSPCFLLKLINISFAYILNEVVSSEK